MFLTLHSGQQVEFPDVELAQTLIRLQAQGQSYCLGEHDTAHITVGGGGCWSSTLPGRSAGGFLKAIK